MKRLFISLFIVLTPFTLADETETLRQSLIAKGVAYLRKTQEPAGGWSIRAGAGPSSVIVTGLLDAGVKVDDPLIKHAIEYINVTVQPDGGIYSPGGHYQTYETSLGIMAFAAVNKRLKDADGKAPYDELLKKAEAYLRKSQYTAANDNVINEAYRGGIGYGQGQQNMRPDLSNVHYFLDALEALDVPSNDPAVQEALKFVSRCQNLESEYNTAEWAKKAPDGGFIYVVTEGDQSQTAQSRGEGFSGRGGAGGASGEGRGAGIGGGEGRGGAGTPSGLGGNLGGGQGQGGQGLRSYASMTYAGLKSMIYAGVTKDDKRVKAAFEWAKKNYDLTQNPGMGANGLYYYYQVLSKTLDTMDLKEMEDAQGKKHDWRKELVEELAKRQNPDGSWRNVATRWMEGDPNLVTGYVMMVLADCE
ncbi:MAG: terpene cyclase/mutase family protein [Planctomycetaceae bacterium]|nr:terpene cyclase/mutase family protein [Planctomycetaceae bacterium]